MNLLDIKKTLVNIWIFASGLMLYVCQTVELIRYEHDPSETFYKGLNTKNSVLEPFFVDEALFVVDVKSAKDEYFIWLGIFSEVTNKKVKLTKAVISGNGLSRESTFDSIIDLASPTKKVGLFQNSRDTFKLFTIDGEWLKEASARDGKLRVQVFFTIDSSEGLVEFELERRIERHNVLPT